MIDQIKSLGFNTIRLPYSNQLFDPSSRPQSINYDKNPDLKDLSPLELMDKIIEYSGKSGLKVILDRHRPESSGQSSLWYTSTTPESKWIADWQMLARRYQGNSTVIGADLHNEPHDNACWGCGDQSLDWKIAAQKAGNAIHEVNPNWLIIVEGVQNYWGNWYWWGGNLMGAVKDPVKLNISQRVIYSTHDYPSSVNPQPWLTDGSFPQNLTGIWDKHWGFIQKSNQAPVLVGEFGSKLQTDADKQWMQSLVRYMADNNISWTFWCFNPNSGDTGGILQDDWNSVNTDKINLIRPAMSQSFTQTVNSLKIDQPSKPVPTSTSVSNSSELSEYRITNEWNGGYIATLKVNNLTASSLTNWQLRFKLPESQKIINLWDGRYTRTGQDVVVTSESWNQTIPSQGSVTIGFQIEYSGNKSAPGDISISSKTSTPDFAPTPTMAPVSNPASTNNSIIEVWWPTSQAPVTGLQPLKAILSSYALTDYDLYWQVDGGELVKLYDSQVDYPHKETSIDFSSWNWKGKGPYTISLVAKNKSGSEIAKSAISVSTQ